MEGHRASVKDLWKLNSFKTGYNILLAVGKSLNGVWHNVCLTSPLECITCTWYCLLDNIKKPIPFTKKLLLDSPSPSWWIYPMQNFFRNSTNVRKHLCMLVFYTFGFPWIFVVPKYLKTSQVGCGIIGQFTSRNSLA